jgi:hypothetical protein
MRHVDAEGAQVKIVGKQSRLVLEQIAAAIAAAIIALIAALCTGATGEMDWFESVGDGRTYG